jgi:AcrR family transcriptional regulator
MRASPKPVIPHQQPQKPAKERIASAANRLFLQYGMNISLRQIAHFAGTQMSVVVKYYGSFERLQADFLQSLFREMDDSWREAEKGYAGDPEAQLRCWIYYVEIQCDEYSSPQWQLARAAAQMAYPIKQGLPLQIDHYRQAERRKIADKCTQAKLRDPGDLADKIVLLIEGARNERGCYGFGGPLQKLGLAADDLMVAHGAVRKPPFDEPD